MKAGLVGLMLAAGLAACGAMGGDTAAAVGERANASATVALGATSRSVGVSNPTNGGPAFVGAGR